ncbi:MAG: hypothetical protein KUG73_00470 [Pseudomonadales bacterium]|nr:hypothetical protein [Pseudomonadales bacterium]
MKQQCLFILLLTAICLSGCNLTIENSGGGIVTSDSGSINCGEQCVASYSEKTEEHLVATPLAGFELHHWEGACDGAIECIVSMSDRSGHKSVKAIFTPVNFNGITIAPVLDQVALQGTTYQYQPTLVSANDVVWRKEYGPDRVSVDATTGEVAWNIAADLPDESFHIGVRALDAQGNSAIETWIVTIGSKNNRLYVGENETYSTVADAVRAMGSGDTVIIKNGTYTGENSEFINANEGGAMPPSGSDAAYSTIMAEDPGRVIFDGRGVNNKMLHIYGSYNEPDDWGNTTLKSTSRNYIALKGIHVHNTLSSGIRIASLHHVKLIDMASSDSGRNAECGFTGTSCGTTNMYITRAHHVLLEGAYTWGHARYQIIFQKARDAVVRRTVSRIDAYIGREPVGVFQTYCSKNIAWQNVIAIDSDSKRFWVRHSNLGNSFGFAATGCQVYPKDSEYHSSIAINNDLPLTGINLDNEDNSHYVTNSIGWGGDMTRYNYGNGGISSYVAGEGLIYMDRITMGRVQVSPGYETIPGGSGRGFFYHRNNPLYVNNSIIYQMGWNGSQVQDQGRFAWSSSPMVFTNNNIFGNVGGINNISGDVSFNSTLESDPTQHGLRYLPRVEEGTDLFNAGTNNTSLGATIIRRLGVSGTFRGEVGWDELQPAPLWPFPHEAIIKEKFADYSYSGPTRSGVEGTVGPDDVLSGARGFAATGTGLYGGPITLTSYIWEQLGNACPTDICNYKKN